MHKEVSYYNEHGERVHNEAVQYNGRYDDVKGYTMYAYGNTVSGRMSATFPKEMNKNDLANMLLLSKHLQFNANIIVYRTNQKYEPMNVERIGRVLGTQDRQTRRFLSKMVRLSMVARVPIPKVERVSDSRSLYIVNPVYFLNGKKITASLYSTFQGKIDNHVPPWVQEKFLKKLQGEKNT